MSLRRAAALGIAALSIAPAASAHDLTPPRPAEPQPVARWPDGAAAAHDVVVPVVLVIGADGHVDEVIVDASLGEPFDAAAIDAARRWAFTPARAEGRPVAAKVRAVIRFLGRAPSPPAAPVAPRPGATQLANGDAEHSHAHVRVLGERPEAVRSASASTLGRPVLGAAPHRTAADLLKTAPGVAIVQHGGDGKAFQIFFRGFDAEHGQDVEVWVGGAPVNDVSNVHGQGYADLHFVPAELVRQLRSTPGTYDPRQGDFAVAGTLRLSLGLDEPGVTVRSQAGSFGARRAFVAYRPVSAEPSTFAAFEAASTTGFGPARAATRASALAQGAWAIGDAARLRVLVSTYASRFDSAGVLRLSDVEGGKIDRFGSYDEDQGGASARTQLVVELASADDGERWSVAPFVVSRSMRLRQDFTGYLEDPVDGRATEQENDAVTLGGVARYARPLDWLSSRDAVEVGVYARSDSIHQSQANVAVDRRQIVDVPVRATIHATNAAGYVDLSLSPARWLVARAGVRQDGLAYSVRDEAGGGGARSAAGSHVGRKASLTASVARGASVVASYGEGFRSPQARSLANGELAPFTTVRSYELGARYRDGALQASAAAFRAELSDDLAFDPATTRAERTPGTSRTGLAADVVAEPAPWITTSTSATYTRAVFRADDGGHRRGDLLPYAPQLVARADLAVRGVVGRVLGQPLRARLGYGASLLHRRPLPFGELAHDVLTGDATAALRLGAIELTCDVYNALDARYYDGEYTFASAFTRGATPSLVPQRHVTVGAPRAWLAGVTLHLLPKASR